MGGDVLAGALYLPHERTPARWQPGVRERLAHARGHIAR